MFIAIGLGKKVPGCIDCLYFSLIAFELWFIILANEVAVFSNF